MEENGVVGLVELDRDQMGGIDGGTLMPSLSSGFCYDLAWMLGAAARGVVWFVSTADTGSYTYGKVGTT